MQSQADVIPARRVIEAAIATNDRLGHENLGSLSYTHGFLPRQQPATSLPASHHAWDEIAVDIPHLFRTYAVRQVLNDMPLLSAQPEDLPDEHLLRASSLFSILAHLYWYCEPEPPETDIPPQIQIPWEQISRRLDRPAPHLSFIDLNTHNWQWIDPHLEQPFVVENLRMAIPLIGNEDERRFQMTPIEMLYLFSPLMEAMLTAQEAVIHDDPESLAQALICISNATKYLSYTSLMKVNPNPYSDFYINPVVWGKTAALFASPFQAKNAPPGPSGTAIPSFTSMDIFFGRKLYQTTVGQETDRTRHFFPKHWRDWLTALEAISVPNYVTQKGDRTLKGIYDAARDAYAGESGLLGRHRLKAYGFLDLSFKAGRVKTLGGVSGSYSERVWDRMATELDESRLERYGLYPQTTHMVPVKRVDSIADDSEQPVRQIVFDIANTGIRYQAGDRCGILPENSDDLIAKTLAALQATGREIIHLNAVWRWHVNLRYGYQEAAELPLHMLLKFGHIRPVDRAVALNLYGLTNNERLGRILDAWAEDQWELWDVLEMLAEGGYNTKRLWKAIPGDYEHLCRIIPPERWRLYSISSIMGQQADELHLTIGNLRYKTQDTDVSHGIQREGTGSSFLARLAAGDSTTSERVSIKVVHPARFSLPNDPQRPIVMFAGGTGIAPMRGLIAERIQQQGSGPMWLFFGTRNRDTFYYQDELARAAALGKLEVRTAFSRDDAHAHFDHTVGQFVIVPGQRQRLDSEMLDDVNAQMLWEMLRSTKEGGQGAYFYLCGRTAFANTVMDAIKAIIARYVVGDTADKRAEIAQKTLYRLIGEDRFLLEIFTTYQGAHFESARQYDISDVVLHNDDQHGYWIIVSGRVYDVNEFNHIHPGGAKIIQSYSGMDATVAYQKIEHHVNSEVDAMLSMYELGAVRTLDFGQQWNVSISDKGLRVITLRDAYYAWVDLLFMVIEIENAILNDFRIRYEPFTDIETSDHVQLTPSKIEQLGLAHERLATGYLDHVLGSPIPTLWALTVGLVGQHRLDARWMRQQLETIQSSEQATTTRKLAAQSRAQLQHDAQRQTATADYFAEQYGPFCDLLETEDRRMIRELKLALREGLLVFEQFEHETVQQGGEQLLGILKTIPTILEGFYGRLSVAVK